MAAKKTSTPRKSASKKKADADATTSLAVNLGHIFALRPRVETSFKPGDLTTAKHFLRDESYSTIEEAARAVAEKAIELNHEASGRRGKKGKGR